MSVLVVRCHVYVSPFFIYEFYIALAVTKLTDLHYFARLLQPWHLAWDLTRGMLEL